MNIIKKIKVLNKKIQEIKKNNKTIGLVATMGNLHYGHIKLILLAKKYSDVIIVSIFTNPTQFDSLIDYKKYPRTLKKDCTLLKKENVDIIFAPEEKDIYLSDKKIHTYVKVPSLSNILEGKSRPGHFIGVTTILCKLFNLIQPNFSFFGEKDYQQLLIVKTLIKELNYSIKIISAPTIRLKNGLAYSSRNKYLSSSEKKIAPFLYKIIKKTTDKIIQKKGENIKFILNASRKDLTKKGFIIDIFDVYNAKQLTKRSENDKNNILLASVWLGKTRLIDNKKIIF
ncbi:pantoate--beta-alanine ligase [Buchnera aphidicola (Melanaphis sacchari)]|uniref:Pantothenate synthetase n=1 Tax=Buchnera aphidicola (Melanaphis sacchari) TaxID=2173854 RepID=A0A2U8DH63_9GAMM|nr:pantoate--beta-alanine ligase [Buchnera aphidicola]AWH90574.1 pantoate--beta-alanine ligase [Buchnera aphidicola (Melanaphis sacchari)]